MGELNDKIAALTAEIEKLKAAQPTPIDPAAVGAWRDQMHQISERRATRAATLGFSPAQLAAMREAAPDDVCAGIVRDNRAPMGPSGAGASGRVDKVSSSPGLPGSNTGWQAPTPLGPQPGINHVDRLMDAQDRQDRADLIRRDEAIRRAERGK